ncbi:MAG TPA: FAD:protein FMN transferase [Bacillota bacterium]|nr:FAD:protein FMN transferase [Bacillota bacterium]HRS20923.1 FAD:protein FMN transferase [Clostridia bacterium]HRU42390.1 FAD:protein FMN transferase [Candidatus Diapherotrites archaeon]HQE66218.1 FAD:protein FMN transferase [Bacillota bacterium]HQI16572.1 FAD:protein FMN transferase [Bacillota bacterium]
MILDAKLRLTALALISVLLLSGCQKSLSNTSAKPLSKTNFLLGTIIEISVYDKKDEALLDKAFERIREIEGKMTINNAENSEIISLNQASGKNEVKLSPDTFYVVEKGKEYSRKSGGLFDITIGPVVKLWNIGTDYAAVPMKNKLEEAVGLVDYRKLSLNSGNYTAFLEEPGMQVDLGAIAKGYAADEAVRILKENGVGHAIINLGGNVITIGGNPNGNPWRIGIQSPSDPRGDYLGIVQIQDQAVVTSGTYERYFEEDGKIYHHILNPITGYPVENNLSSASIITGKSIDGDGLSTTVLLMGLEEGMKLVESLENVEAVFITNDKTVYVSSGLKNNFKITNSEYKYPNNDK